MVRAHCPLSVRRNDGVVVAQSFKTGCRSRRRRRWNYHLESWLFTHSRNSYILRDRTITIRRHRHERNHSLLEFPGGQSFAASQLSKIDYCMTSRNSSGSGHRLFENLGAYRGRTEEQEPNYNRQKLSGPSASQTPGDCPRCGLPGRVAANAGSAGRRIRVRALSRLSHESSSRPSSAWP